jgi:hypothetical protein
MNDLRQASDSHNNISWSGGVSFPALTCTDTLSQETAMKALSSKPPVPLVQPYFQCHPTVQQSVLNAIGSSSGSASLYSTIFMSIVGFLVVRYINFRKSRVVNGVHLKYLKSGHIEKELENMKLKRALQSIHDVTDHLVENMKNLQEYVGYEDGQCSDHVKTHLSLISSVSEKKGSPSPSSRKSFSSQARERAISDDVVGGRGREGAKIWNIHIKIVPTLAVYIFGKIARHPHILASVSICCTFM